MNILNRVGKRYGKLVVVRYLGKNIKKQHTWECVCDCGNNTIAVGNYLGHRKNSCGCQIGAKKTHGQRKTRVYKSWMEMLDRIRNPKNGVYKYYGGRGIEVCKEWLTFEGFYEDMGDRPEGMTLERIYNNGNYDPFNCKWATPLEQARNRRNNIYIEYDGIIKCLSEWAYDFGVKPATMWARHKRGCVPPELFAPVGEL